MRKLPGILLLLCLAAPLIGTYAGLRFEKYRVRKELKIRMLAGLPDSVLVFFQFSKNACNTLLRWEHAREFEYRGEMFDVVKQSVRNDSLLLWCWRDHAETKLNSQLRRLIAEYQNNDPCRHEKEHRLALFFLTLFHEDAPDWRVYGPQSDNPQLLTATYALLSANEVAPPFPPPDGV